MVKVAFQTNSIYAVQLFMEVHILYGNTTIIPIFANHDNFCKLSS